MGLTVPVLQAPVPPIVVSSICPQPPNGQICLTAWPRKVTASAVDCRGIMAVLKEMKRSSSSHGGEVARDNIDAAASRPAKCRACQWCPSEKPKR